MAIAASALCLSKACRKLKAVASRCCLACPTEDLASLSDIAACAAAAWEGECHQGGGGRERNREGPREGKQEGGKEGGWGGEGIPTRKTRLQQ